MGLDQYAVKVKKSAVIDKFNYKQEINGEKTWEELYYWRKVLRLQGWMENLYREKGGEEEEFNCVNVRVDTKDLTRLKDDVRHDRLPETTGFFFGRHFKEDMDSVMEFIKLARKAIKDGYVVYYSSWW